MSDLIEHARREMKLAGLYDYDSDYGGMLPEGILKLVEVFSEEDHSGGSASLAISILDRVLRFEPLTPLTGSDDEWFEVSDGVWQNNRCSHVFKDTETGAYDIDGRLFRYPDGSVTQRYESRVPIEFPYTPSHTYVDVDENGEVIEGGGDG